MDRPWMWPDQLVLALIVLGVASLALVTRAKWRRAAFAVAVLSIANVVLLFGPFEELRLLTLRDAMPLSAAPVSPPLTPASCLCATRRTLLDMFGRPDFIRASMVGDRYAYWLAKQDGEVVIYHLETREESLGDRVLRIEHRVGTSEPALARDGMTPPAPPTAQPGG